MKKRLEPDDCIVTYNDDEKTRKAVFDAVIKLFVEHTSFDGESIIQSDWASIDGPEFLADLADDILKFDVKYEDE